MVICITLPGLSIQPIQHTGVRIQWPRFQEAGNAINALFIAVHLPVSAHEKFSVCHDCISLIQPAFACDLL